MSSIHQLELPNGLHLVAEPMDGAESLSLSLLLPAGAAHEPQGRQGVAALLAEMICRGAGDRDARAHTDALDLLGVQRGTNVQGAHLQVAATMIGDRLSDALPLLADMVLAPRLEDASLEPSRDLAVQAIESLEDEPQQKVFYALRSQHMVRPFGRSPLGEIATLERITIDQVREYRLRTFVPRGTVLGVAGRFDWPELASQVHHLMGTWIGHEDEPQPGDLPRRGYTHIEAPTQQVHIGLAYDAVPEDHPDSLLQRAAVAVLSGGMSGRLFTEVREKRGLCYSVFAAYTGQRHRSAVLSYAGTTVARAQETLDVLVNELRGLSGNVTQAEFDRMIVGMKSGLVMQGESTAARASAIASDQDQLGRPRTLDERLAAIDALTLDALNDYTSRHAPGQMTLVTIGPDVLKPATIAP